MDSGSLRISSVAVSDAGNYDCIAKNKAGSAQRKISLDVQGLISRILFSSSQTRGWHYKKGINFICLKNLVFTNF